MLSRFDAAQQTKLLPARRVDVCAGGALGSRERERRRSPREMNAMKLRTRANTIRLRLTQGEVARIAEGQSVEEHLYVGPTEADALGTELRPSPSIEGIGARFEGRTLVVELPRGLATAWARGDEVGLRAEVPAPGGRTLGILIEKDFACLTRRAAEEDEDAFPNPNTSCC